MTAARVVEFPRRRAPSAAPVNKLEILKRVRELIREGELLPRDMLVAEYIGEITDKNTGLAVVELATIAERIGASRRTVVRALGRLIDSGLMVSSRWPPTPAGTVRRSRT